jgi:hypothetical protein
MAKEHEYSFLTTKSFRVSVKAHSAEQAYKRARKKLFDSNLKGLSKFGADGDFGELTTSYGTYGKNGIGTGFGFRNVKIKKRIKV